MTEWKTYRLGDVISIKSGFAYKGEYLGKGDKYLLGMGCVSFNEKFLPSGARLYAGDVPSRYFVKAGDIVLATRQQSDNLPILGMPAIIPSTYKNTFVGANLYAVQNGSDIDNNYLYWLLKTPEYIQHIKSCQTGTTVRMITKSNIESFEFKCPNRIERNRISNLLWSLENKIENNRRINDNLEQQAQALYKQWFVDFEFPNEEGKPYKSSGGKMVDSELGLIPEGWSVGKLEDIGDIIGGGTPSKAVAEYYTKNGIAWITPKYLSVSHLKFTAKGETDITELGYKNSSAKIMPRGSVLFSSRAPIGYISIAKNDICTNQGFKSVVPNNGCTAFVYYFLLSNTENIESKATGSTFKEASGALMKSLALVIPSDDILEKFEKIMSPIFEAQEKFEAENEALSTLRDTLLPKLMNGEIKI